MTERDVINQMKLRNGKRWIFSRPGRENYEILMLLVRAGKLKCIDVGLSKEVKYFELK